MAGRIDALEQLLCPVIESMGYECWGLEFQSRPGSALLRVYIDKPEGISLEDCERVTRQVSGVLDVEDPIPNAYTLEVSSPGMDRTLFTLDQYRRFIGSQVKIRLRAAYEGRRKYEGLLAGVEGDEVVIRVGEEELLFPFESIDRGSIVPVFD